MKRKAAILMALVLGAFSLWGCGGDSAATGNTEDTKDSSSDGKKEITFWHYMSEDKEGKYINAAVEEFNESQDEIHVTPQYLPREELMKQYSIGVVSGELPDCGMVDNPDHNSYVSMGVFEDITDRFNEWEEANFLEGSLNSCKYEDRIYGLPWGNNCLGLFYDVDMLEEAGVAVPTNWTELEAACEKLTKDGVKGLAISAIGDEEGTFQYMPWLLSAGGNVDDIESDAAKESLTYLKDLIDKGYISKECVSWSQADAEKQFASGQAAMMINGPWQFSGLKEDSPEKNYGVAKVPKADDGEYASVLGGENVAICKGADVDASWTFLTYMTNKANSEKICKEIGRFSPRADVDTSKMFSDDPLQSAFAEAMVDAQSRGPSVKWPEVSEAIYTAEQEVFTGQKDIDTALADAQKKIDEINASIE